MAIVSDSYVGMQRSLRSTSSLSLISLIKYIKADARELGARLI